MFLLGRQVNNRQKIF